MIDNTFIFFTTENGYTENISDVSEESLSFVSQPGYEKLVTQNKEFHFIPTNGSKGQVLKRGEGFFYWADPSSIAYNESIGNLNTENSIYIIKLKTNNDDRNIQFVGKFTKGQEIILYITLHEDVSYDIADIKLDEELFFDFKGAYEYPITKNNWLKLHFVYDGSKLYTESEYVKANEQFFTRGDLANSIILDNGTLQSRTNYGFAVGRYNEDIRRSSQVENFGSGSSLFTVGNGLNTDNRHSAIDIRDDGSIAIVDTKSEGKYYEKPTIILQDYLIPNNGEEGQILVKTSDGFEWKDPDIVFEKYKTSLMEELKEYINSKENAGEI